MSFWLAGSAFLECYSHPRDQPWHVHPSHQVHLQNQTSPAYEKPGGKRPENGVVQ